MPIVFVNNKEFERNRMVDYFSGIIKELKDQEIVLDVGGIGITLQVATTHHFGQAEAIKVYSHLHWNAENGPSLFGFSSPLERSVFRIIISCSGIGPKIALAILADLGAQSFLNAIVAENEQALSNVSGIGKKKAEQIIVQLKHKVASLVESGKVDMSEMQESSHLHDVTLALQSLNYSRPEISRAMEYVKKNTKMDKVTFDILLRQALSYLSKQM
jgi:Holliday junction DNA helicase RuvA